MADWRRILIIHGGAIGDLVLALPAIGAVRQSCPQAILELLARPALHPLLERQGLVDHVGTLDGRPLHHLFSPELPKSLWDDLRRFDLIISWFGSGSEAYRQALARLPVRTLVARAVPSEASQLHAVDYLIHTLAPLGISTDERTPRLWLTESDRQEGRQLLDCWGIVEGSLVALHPGSGSPRKCWPAERFAELALILWQRGMRIVVIEGPADAQVVDDFWSWTAKRMEPVPGDRLLRLSQVSLRQVAIVLDRCTVYVGNDSGITHLAAALGTPTVAIFSVTDPKIWGPRGNVTILEGVPSVDAAVAALESMLSLALSAKR